MLTGGIVGNSSVGLFFLISPDKTVCPTAHRGLALCGQVIPQFVIHKALNREVLLMFPLKGMEGSRGQARVLCGDFGGAGSQAHRLHQPLRVTRSLLKGVLSVCRRPTDCP